MSPVGSLRTSQRVKVTGEAEGKFQKDRAPFCEHLARIRLSGARERVPKKAYLVAAVFTRPTLAMLVAIGCALSRGFRFDNLHPYTLDYLWSIARVGA